MRRDVIEAVLRTLAVFGRGIIRKDRTEQGIAAMIPIAAAIIHAR